MPGLTSTPNQSDFEESDTSTGSQGGRLSVSSGSYSKIQLRFRFPKTYVEIDDYHERLGEEILRVSGRSDDKDRIFYDRIRQIKDFEKPLPWLDRVPKRYVKLDREVFTKLEESIKDREELMIIVKRLRTDYRSKGEKLTSRRLLVTLCQRLDGEALYVCIPYKYLFTCMLAD